MPAMALLGVGTDVVEIRRIAALAERHGERFRRRILSESEQAVPAGRERPVEFLAGRWAAKEAVMKALGHGWGQGVAFREIEIGRDPRGKPTVRLLGRTRGLARRLGAARIEVSISHDGGIAVAVAAAEGRRAAP